MRFPRVPAVPWGRSSGGGLLGPDDPAEHRPGATAHDRPGFEHRLRDGRRVFLTPVLPGDRHRLEAGFEQLSDQSRVFRFFRQRDRLSEAEIQRLIQVDQVDHVAWCALDLPDPPFDGLGSGRLIRDPGDPEKAEVAVTVIDAAQRHGLGTVLLAVLVLRARMLGISTLTAHVLPENRVVVRWLKDLGWTIVRDEGSLEFEDQARPDPSRVSEFPARARFEQLLDDLEPRVMSCLAVMAGRAASGPPAPLVDGPEDDHPEGGAVEGR